MPHLHLRLHHSFTQRMSATPPLLLLAIHVMMNGECKAPCFIPKDPFTYILLLHLLVFMLILLVWEAMDGKVWC